MLAKGLVERIGIEGSLITANRWNKRFKKQIFRPQVGIKLVMDAFKSARRTNLDRIAAVGLVVHGGEKLQVSYNN